MSEDTRPVSTVERGDPHAAGRLLPLVYDELRKLATKRMARERPGQTLQPTTLIHEAYLRLVGQGDPGWLPGSGCWPICPCLLTAATLAAGRFRAITIRGSVETRSRASLGATPDPWRRADRPIDPKADLKQ
jgi:hypothetical protein